MRTVLLTTALLGLTAPLALAQDTTIGTESPIAERTRGVTIATTINTFPNDPIRGTYVSTQITALPPNPIRDVEPPCGLGCEGPGN